MTANTKGVDAYIKGYKDPARSRLEQIRRVVLAAVPGLEERLSYGMPAYFLNGKVVIYYGAHAAHLGVYPGRVAQGDLKELLSGYLSGASTAKFAYSEPLPKDLITKLVQFRASEVAQKGAKRG